MVARYGLILLTIVAVASVASGQNRIDDNALRDVRQTIQARKRLADVPELAELNIGVIVVNRVAVLWGPVPSAAEAFRAEVCLRTMIELADVRSELLVSEPLDLIRRPLKINRPPQLVPDRLPPFATKESSSIFAAPGVVTGQAPLETKLPSAAPKTQPLEIKAAPPEIAPTPTLGVPELDQIPKKLPN